MSDKPPQITNRRPLLVAHRGASAEKPENTLAAFRRAVALGVDAIELDVHVTRDGVVVVFHDDDLFRLTGVRGRLATKTWRELFVLRVRGAERIPKLVDVLRLTRGRAVVQIEIKAGVPVAPVVRAVKSAKAMKDVVLASFAPDIVRETYRLAPTVPRMLIAEGRRTPASQVAQLAACQANGLSVNQRAIRSASYIRHFHRRGYAVWSWTVNEPRRMQALVGWGIDGILTDNPALLKQVV
jgi:glycerophosphoryl diester phosphodiesterase